MYLSVFQVISVYFGQFSELFFEGNTQCICMILFVVSTVLQWEGDPGIHGVM